MTAIEDRPPARFADYLAVLELDESQIRHGSSVGKVSQKFPEEEWPDIPFSYSLQTFCAPQGWNLIDTEKEPTFFVCTLTDLMGAHQYACCLQTYVQCTPVAIDECDESFLPSVTLYKPKVFVILSRYPFFDIFRACLNRIYTTIKTDVLAAEIMIATILSSVQLTGRNPISFSLGSERFSVRPILQQRVPVTGERVFSLIKNLGSIHNLLIVVRAVICDMKIILFSSSLSRLSNSAYAIKSLIYPLEYTNTFVSVLPESMLEYLESPTPYLMGVLSSVREKLPAVEAVMVDLDIGEVNVPLGITIPAIPNPFYDRIRARLQLVLSPELSTEDFAVPQALPPPPDPAVLDKNIRACFLLFFAELLYGYRSCLELVRLHKLPLIVFHKAAFMGMRRLHSPLLHQLVESQMFQLFVASRGLPFRECDVFDDIVCTATGEDNFNLASAIEQNVAISKILFENEKQERMICTTPTLSKKATFSYTNQPTDEVTQLDATRINNMIALNEKNNTKTVEKSKAKYVPVPEKYCFVETVENANSRRLLVLSTCVVAIFENRLSEARKMMCAVELSLRLVEARVALCRQLAGAAIPVTKATLHPPQFELIVRLLNTALEMESDEDEHGIAYACLHLCNLYCRRLSQGVHQFAYTCVQDHGVWSNQRFWEAAFFHDVHELMRQQYGTRTSDSTPLNGSSRTDMWNLLDEPTGMYLAATRLASINEISEEDLSRLNNEEESILYGQAKHYINLMVYLRVPLDASRLRRIDKFDLEQRGGRNRDRNESVSDSDCESGFIENVNDGDLGAVVVTWISRLIDRICSAAGLEARLTERLIQDIPGFVAVHIDNLEQVYAESRKLAPPPKTKLLAPVLLTPCEKILVGGLRCVLLADGRSISIESFDNNPSLLPAEGALFLTNYRIVFKGRPINPFLNEEVVVRSEPLMSLTKEKNISDQALNSGGQLDGVPSKLRSGLHDAIQMRTTCFQLIKVAFDEEVTCEQVENFSKTLTMMRWPSVIPHTLFAYSAVSHLLNATLTPASKSKYNTIKKNIVHLKSSISRKTIDKHQWSTPMNPVMKALTTPAKSDTFANNSDYLDLSDMSEHGSPIGTDHSGKYFSDYERLRLKGSESICRISYANKHYVYAKSYPSLFVVPSAVSDDIFAKIGKGFKHGRFPVVTWISENGAFLIRGSGLTSTNMVAKIKKQTNFIHGTESTTHIGGSRSTLSSKESADTSSPMHSAEYQEQYLSKLAMISPSGTNNLSSLSDSVGSIYSVDSLFTTDGLSLSNATPEFGRKSTTDAAQQQITNFVRNSGGKTGARTLLSVSTTNQNRPMSTIPRPISDNRSSSSISSVNRKNLYMLVEKSHMKVLRCDKNVEFVPISFPTTHHMKVALKKLLRVMKPSWSTTEAASTSFYRSLDDSGWMIIISQLLSVAFSMSSVIHVHNSSVALCIEDGWDTTCQLMSLTQILLDPYYRTIEGFRVLIEKEWLAFGHRFSHRANQTISSQNSGITPVFFMFLDAVHQLLDQFPQAFEFNDFYLRFLAYHSQAAFFRTFLLDSEMERVQLEQLAPDTTQGHRGCIWAYIRDRCSRSPIFHNLIYSPPSVSSAALVPSTSVASLKLWSFYYEDYVSHGSPYDIDIAETELSEREEEKFSQSEGVTRADHANVKIVDSALICPDLSREDGITFTVQTNDRLNPLEKPKSGRWLMNWEAAEQKLMADDAESIQTEEIPKTKSATAWDSYILHYMMKRSALRVLLRGSSQQALFQKQAAPKVHSFEHYSTSGGQYAECALCHYPLYGTVVKTGQRCRQCGVVVHDKCKVNMTNPCGREISPSPHDTSTLVNHAQAATVSRSETIQSEIGHNSKTLTMSRNANGKAAPLHQGYLSKKGAKLGLWTQRWFVLEADNHKLHYTESKNDLESRGSIDLCEVSGVDVKDAKGSMAYLELRTNKRTYVLQAEKRADAELWKEKIEHVLGY